MIDIYILQLRLLEDVLASLSAHSSLEEAENAALVQLNTALKDNGYPPQTDLGVAEQMCCDLEIALFNIDTFELGLWVP